MSPIPPFILIILANQFARAKAMPAQSVSFKGLCPIKASNLITSKPLFLRKEDSWFSKKYRTSRIFKGQLVLLNIH